jgi:hypothetical protein
LDAFDQGPFGADDHEIDSLCERRLDDEFDVFGGSCDATSERRNPRVARNYKEFGDNRRL